MTNITYDIIEKNENTYVNVDDIMNEYQMTSGDINYENDETMSIYLNYLTNYTVKDLGYILDYYKISKRKLKKENMVNIIVAFELEEDNQATVYRRKELWNYAIELKTDPYFNKLLIFNPPIL